MLDWPTGAEEQSIVCWDSSVWAGLAFHKVIKGVKVEGLVKPVKMKGNTEVVFWVEFKIQGEDTVVWFNKHFSEVYE